MTRKDKKKTTPAGRDDDTSGYAERKPRDKDDARNLGKRPSRDPEDGGLARKTGDGADPADD